MVINSEIIVKDGNSEPRKVRTSRRRPGSSNSSLTNTSGRNKDLDIRDDSSARTEELRKGAAALRQQLAENPKYRVITEPGRSFEFRGKLISVTYPSSISRTTASLVLTSEPFQQWVENSSKVYGTRSLEIHGVEIQSVDMVRKTSDNYGDDRLLDTIKINVNGTVKDTEVGSSEHRLPGIVTLRGKCVAVMVNLKCMEDKSEWTLLLEQPRISIGAVSTLELPTGRIFGDSGIIMGSAFAEMEEVCGVDLDSSDLIDLTKLAYENSAIPSSGVLHASPGHSDESVQIMYSEINVSRAELKVIRARLSERRDEVTSATYRVVPLHDLWRATTDMKAICALFLYTHSHLVNESTSNNSKMLRRMESMESLRSVGTLGSLYSSFRKSLNNI